MLPFSNDLRPFERKAQKSTMGVRRKFLPSYFVSEGLARGTYGYKVQNIHVHVSLHQHVPHIVQASRGIGILS